MNDLYIVDQAALVDFCASLRDALWLALDTEFIREQTYYPQLCLIQIAVPGQTACIDPLALPSLDPLLELLYQPSVTKVLHAAHQDLELLFHWCGTTPVSIFDTQLAALVLGYGSQIGYAALVQQELGVELSKAHTRADWRRRPLAPEWLKYAADDVRYLAQLYPKLRAALQDHGWLEALTEDFAALRHPDRYRMQPQEAWRRLREERRLSGGQRAVLRALAAWREEQAIASDRPRGWILPDAVLLELARRMPSAEEQLQGIRGLPAATWQRHGPVLLERMAAARAESPADWPTRPARPRLTAAQVTRVAEWLAVIATRARARGIAPQAVADRRDVENLVVGWDSPLSHGWRAALIGRELQAQPVIDSGA